MTTAFPDRVRRITAILALATLTAACSISNDDESDGGEDDDELTLTLIGPEIAAPVVAVEGFVAELKYGDGRAAEDIYVSLIPTLGAVDAPATSSGSNGSTTDGFGRIRFAYRAPSSIDEETLVTIEARADTTDETVQASLDVTVRPDTFGFTSPADGSSITVGASNAQPFSFQWTRSSDDGVEGVEGDVTLSTDNDNVRFSVNGIPASSSTSVSVQTTGSGGNFATNVAVYALQRGSATITAANDENSAQTASVYLTFVDHPTSINLTASPLTVSASPSENRTSTLTAKVLNEENQPIPDIDVSFTLSASISGSVNERVFPTGGVTSTTGEAISQYEAGSVTGTAKVKACVKDSELCSEREIVVEASSE